jgi:transposase
MTDKMAIRTFPTAYKLKAIKRAEGGEGVLPVARKLGISRKLLHDWIKAWKADGPAGLNRKRGPKPGPGNYGDSALNQAGKFSTLSP